jgi:radical SAM protein with 4Fe4S-binding SPASM domain
MAEIIILDDMARYNTHLAKCDQCWHAHFCWDMCDKGRELQEKSFKMRVLMTLMDLRTNQVN